MGRWRNKWENEPKAPKSKSPDFTAFDTRLFDPVNALISNSDKLELQALAQAAAQGDPAAIKAYHEKIYGSGLLQEEKDALANMFTYSNPKSGRGNKNIKASPVARYDNGGSSQADMSPQDVKEKWGSVIDEIAPKGIDVGDSFWDDAQSMELLKKAREDYMNSSGLGGGNIKPSIQDAPPTRKQSAKERMRAKYGMTGPGAMGRPARY